MGKQKGNAYEREVCRLLSLWWSCDQSDDIFYRTNSSGGRATQRAKKGKTTSGHHGDVAANDPSGGPFLKLFTVELKRGYNSSTLSDLLDRSPTSAVCCYEEWVRQAEEAAGQSGSLGWMIVHRRDRRQALVLLPGELWRRLYGDDRPSGDHHASFKIRLRQDRVWLCSSTLGHFVGSVTPERVRLVVNTAIPGYRGTA